MRLLQALIIGSAAVALVGCDPTVHPASDLVAVRPVDVVQLSDMISAFKGVVRDIGRYDVEPTRERRDCPAHILAYPSKVEVTYQEATNITLAGTASGNIPVPGFILSPSLTGSNAKVNTTSQTISFSYKPGDFQVRHSLILTPGVQTTDVKSVPTDASLRQAIENIIQGYLNSDHAKPCTQPGDVVMSVAFSVENKVGGGVDLNFLVAKIGGTVTSTKTTTQTAKITFSFKGSLAVSF